MEICTTYVANDGTAFDNEDDCLVYEKMELVESTGLGNKIKCFSPKGTYVEPKKAISHWGEVYYIIISDDISDEELKTFNTFIEKEEYYYNHFTKGIWEFCIEADEWINLTRELADLQEKINKISNWGKWD